MDEPKYDLDMLTESDPASNHLTSTSPVGTSKQLREDPNSGSLSVLLSAAFFVWLVLLFADCAAHPASAQTRAHAVAPYSVVVLILDDIASADLALYGGPVAMPNLERYAAGGMVFTNAYANPSCSPSRRSLQFGRWWCSESGSACEPGPDPLAPPSSEVSLAQALPKHASAMVGKWHLGGDPDSNGGWACAPLLRGYDYWAAGIYANPRTCSGTSYTKWERVLPGCTSGLSTEYEPQAVADVLFYHWANTPKPALAVVAPALAHGPFHVPPANLLPAGYPTPITARQRYEAMIRAMDTLLLRTLAAVNLLDTVVIVVGDNGTPQQVAPDPDRAKTTTFERGIRVPLVVFGGPVVPGESDALVHIVDVWASAIELGGGSVPQPAYPVASESLLPVLTGKPGATHDFVLCGHNWGSAGGDRAAVSADGFKLRQLDDDGDAVVDVEELYDLRQDPTESANLVGQAELAPRLTELRAFIAAEAP